MFRSTSNNYISGMEVLIRDARQMRMARDVPGPRVRPKVPSKLRGRVGTRRAWKRRNPPRVVEYFHREPTDMLMLMGKLIATPQQADFIRRQTVKL